MGDYDYESDNERVRYEDELYKDAASDERGEDSERYCLHLTSPYKRCFRLLSTAVLSESEKSAFRFKQEQCFSHELISS